MFLIPRKNIKIKDFSRNSNTATGVGNIDNIIDSRFTRCRREDEISLLSRVTTALEIIYSVQARLAKGNSGIEEVLDSSIIHWDPFKSQIFGVTRFNWSWQENWVLQSETGNASFKHSDPAGHCPTGFNPSTKLNPTKTKAIQTNRLHFVLKYFSSQQFLHLPEKNGCHQS